MVLVALKVMKNAARLETIHIKSVPSKSDLEISSFEGENIFTRIQIEHCQLLQLTNRLTGYNKYCYNLLIYL